MTEPAAADPTPAPEEPEAEAKREPDAKVATEAPADRKWLEPESRSRRIIFGLGIYLACLVVFALVAGDRMSVHTPYNHFAHLADAWLHGRHDLRGGAPGYAGNNDFAVFEGKTFISFPPFPAMVMLPIVAIAGSPENFRDAQFVVWLAGIGPAVLFLILEKLRRTGRSERSEKENLQLALLFAFGTVYFFTAVQGTVWFAAHVIGIGLTALFVLCALDAERPILSGALLGCMFLTRTTTLLLGSFFVFEAIRASYMKREAAGTRELPSEGTLGERFTKLTEGIDRGHLLRLGSMFAVPIAVALGFAAWLNFERFHDPRPWAFGHEYLTVGWQGRIRRWGLFSYHFLPRNLSVMLASLPWRHPPGEVIAGRPPFMISGHGLALWFTTPIYFWLLRPKRVTYLTWAAGLAALGPLVMNLLYQNSGWYQFGYRFSNDYAILLFVMLAVGSRKLGRLFWLAAIWAIAWNLLGAVTFERPAFGNLYSHDPNLIYPAD
jgi:chromate transport protein ChrA